MNFIDRILNSLVGLWRFTETLAKVEKNKADIQEMDGRIDARLDELYKDMDARMDKLCKETDARLDKSWRENDHRMDEEKSLAAAARADLKEQVARLDGRVEEISRQRGAIS